jgi:hypothetical protein
LQQVEKKIQEAKCIMKSQVSTKIITCATGWSNKEWRENTTTALKQLGAYCGDISGGINFEVFIQVLNCIKNVPDQSLEDTVKLPA